MTDDASSLTEAGSVRRVLYDGECNVCRALAYQVQRRDVAERLSLVPYQLQDNSGLPAEVSTNDLECALHVVLEDGTMRRGAAAVMAVLESLPPPLRWIGRAGTWGPVRRVADALYGPFARHRRFWSRWLTHDQD
jgi:predicted DCC family thiol-disulfide oxidoreductase YuxK